jgi:hypothetical protein
MPPCEHRGHCSFSLSLNAEANEKPSTRLWLWLWILYRLYIDTSTAVATIVSSLTFDLHWWTSLAPSIVSKLQKIRQRIKKCRIKYHYSSFLSFFCQIWLQCVACYFFIWSRRQDSSSCEFRNFSMIFFPSFVSLFDFFAPICFLCASLFFLFVFSFVCLSVLWFELSPPHSEWVFSFYIPPLLQFCRFYFFPKNN